MPAKNVGKQIVTKSAKTLFLYSHEFRDQKMEEKSAKQFFHKHTNSASKKCWEKNRLNTVRKQVSYIHTNFVTKKWGEKRAKLFFQKKHQ